MLKESSENEYLKCILLGAKQPGCVVSVLSDTSSVCLGLFLALLDNF